MRQALIEVDNGVLGSAYDPSYDDLWHVRFQKYNRDVPGTYPPSETSFSCERMHNGQVVEAVGFFSEQQCWEWLTWNGEYRFNIVEENGDETEIVREGRGIPSGLVNRMIYDLN